MPVIKSSVVFTIAGLGEFVAQMLRALGAGILVPLRIKRTPDVSTNEINSSISAFVCGSSANTIEREQQRENGSEAGASNRFWRDA